jgi:hypothetical protein
MKKKRLITKVKKIKRHKITLVQIGNTLRASICAIIKLESTVATFNQNVTALYAELYADVKILKGSYDHIKNTQDKCLELIKIKEEFYEKEKSELLDSTIETGEAGMEQKQC